MAPTSPPKSVAKHKLSPPGSPENSAKRHLRSSHKGVAKSTSVVKDANVTKGKKATSAKDRNKAKAKAAKDAAAEEIANKPEVEIEPEVDLVPAPEAAPEREIITVGKQQDIRDFKLGHVITRANHVPFVSNEATGMDTTSDLVTQTKFGLVYSKTRKFVIISRHLDHMVCLPIFSHGGTGLSRKPNKRDYVGIRDGIYFFNTIDESPNGPALITERQFRQGEFFGKKDWSVVGDKSYVHLTQPVCVRYVENCTIDCLMKRGDFAKLVGLYNRFKPTADAPPAVRPPPRNRS